KPTRLSAPRTAHRHEFCRHGRHRRPPDSRRDYSMDIPTVHAWYAGAMSDDDALERGEAADMAADRMDELREENDNLRAALAASIKSERALGALIQQAEWAIESENDESVSCIWCGYGGKRVSDDLLH